MKYFRRIKSLNTVLFLAVLYACSPTAQQKANSAAAAETTEVSRPREAWVLRSVLDQQPRMLSVALHDSLWVAYNTQTASLYKAWKGNIDFSGAVYTTAHGPQPVTKGRAYLEEPDQNPWRIQVNGAVFTPEIWYKGHSIRHKRVFLKYELAYNNQRIQVEESPEFIPATDGPNGLERRFVLGHVPAGTQVLLEMRLTGTSAQAVLKTDGKFVSRPAAAESDRGQPEGQLLLHANGKTRVQISLLPKPVVPVVKKESLKPEEVVLALMAKSDCNTCHNREVKTVGPAYLAIARKYENNGQNLEDLVLKVVKGGAGNWGEVPMTPHPDLEKADAYKMVAYILSLDNKEEKDAKDLVAYMPAVSFPIRFQRLDPAQVNTATEKAGLAINAYQFSHTLNSMPEITPEMQPALSGTLNALHLKMQDFDQIKYTHKDFGFGQLKYNFVLHATGFIDIKKTTNMVFRLLADDGAELFLDGRSVLKNFNNTKGPRDAELLLQAGKHPFKIAYSQGNTINKRLSLQWRPYGAKEFVVVPPDVFTFKGADIKRVREVQVAVKKETIPGDTSPLVAVHPAFTLAPARPLSFMPKVGGMDFLPDGRLVVSTWDSLGAVYLLEGVQGNNPEAIKVKRIAFGLAEPLGIKVVDGDIYVLQKQELTRLVDTNKDDLVDEYQTVCNGWKVSANFHEFAFGLVYKNGYFYGTLATAINPGGASTRPQIPDRGKVVKINPRDGSFSFIASGLRTPNGIGLGINNDIFIADNQGDWLPASKILHLQEGSWYGSRSVDYIGTAALAETPPVVWLPQNEIGNSPSQPALLNIGPYKNQMIHGEVTHGGIKRVFVEKVKGTYQGAVFRFTQGLESGVNRLVWGPDSSLYIGGLGSTGNWSHSGKRYGLQKLSYNGQTAFEMLTVSARPNGVEIEFTEPLQEGTGSQAADYAVKQWYYKPTSSYGGPKLDPKDLAIRDIRVSGDRRKVFLELAGMKPRQVVYIRLNRNTLVSKTGKRLWATEAWYTMTNIPDAAGPLN